MILLVLNFESDSSSLAKASNREVKPSSIVIIRVVGTDPDLKLSIQFNEYGVIGNFNRIAAVARIKVRIDGDLSEIKGAM